VVRRRVRMDVGVERCWVPGVWRWVRRWRRGGDGGGFGVVGEEEEEEVEVEVEVEVMRGRIVEVRREGL